MALLPRTPADKKTRRTAARTPGTWSRARRWLGRLLGRPEAASPGATAKRTSTLDRSEVEAVRRELSAVLDQHPQSRTVMRYAQALERGLEKKGRHALDDLPVEVIRRALVQLEPVVTDWSTEGLRTLRSKAAIAVAGRERAEADQAEARKARQDEDQEVEVEEASVTTFMRASEEWERSFTGRSQPAPLDEAAGSGDAADTPPKTDR